MSMRLNNIKSMGVELEGGWDRTLPGVDVYGDGSVSVNGRESGEIQSPGIETLEEMKAWLRRNWPDHVNATCGFHIHLKLRTLGAYMGLMEKPFINFLVKKLRIWGDRNLQTVEDGNTLRIRLAGRNTYCRNTFNPDAQAMTGAKISERYSIVNFCWKLHGTVEIRVLPMFRNVEHGIGAFETVVLAVVAYSRKKKHSGEIMKAIFPEPTSQGEVETICV